MNFKINKMRLGVLLGLTAAILVGGCASSKLKATKPIIPITEYEKMLFGKMTADYVGNENCLKGCHTHDKLALDFKSSTMGDQLKQSSSGMMVVDCESCHGPASELMAALEGLTVEKDNSAIVKAHRDNLLDYETLPSGAKSLICLKCHTANATFNIHNWNGSTHAGNDVTCSNCHPIHAGADLITEPRAISTLCLGCHISNAAQFSLPSHHPVKEGRMYCTDCHDAHGTSYESNLREMNQRETCGRCHTEKTGPFLFEHSDNAEKCSTCHAPHGSINNNLLKLPVAFLCKQCHTGHSLSATVNQRTFTRCTDCHSTIHGTDLPTPASGNVGGFYTR
ncbi:MAG: DmsE family decaheme c-type cytochrome [Desulfobulbaceae bacterium]|nr:DmsE family decaheme c-type cytochrome [Desulfobulbaceae bacterium]